MFFILEKNRRRVAFSDDFRKGYFLFLLMLELPSIKNRLSQCREFRKHLLNVTVCYDAFNYTNESLKILKSWILASLMRKEYKILSITFCDQRTKGNWGSREEFLTKSWICEEGIHFTDVSLLFCLRMRWMSIAWFEICSILYKDFSSCSSINEANCEAKLCIFDLVFPGWLFVLSILVIWRLNNLPHDLKHQLKHVYLCPASWWLRVQNSVYNFSCSVAL